MTKLDKDQVIEAFTQAYVKANGSQPDIQAKGGWYSVDGGKNVRLTQLAEMTETLGGEATPAEAPASKAEAAPKAAKASKAPTKAKKAKPAKGGFSVKQFWAEQLNERNPGAQAPR